jgi:para-nitrobenzyl esterase
MNASRSRRTLVALTCAALAALTLSVADTAAADNRVAADSSSDPVVTLHSGAVRGVTASGGYAFRGMPYAAPPTGDLRWRPPEPGAADMSVDNQLRRKLP